MSEQFSQEPQSDSQVEPDVAEAIERDEATGESADVTVAPQATETAEADADTEVQAPEQEPAPAGLPQSVREGVSEDAPHPGNGGAPETGDLVIDAALRDLADAPDDDLDAQIERGEQVQRTLQGRLSDLGG